MTEVEKLKQDLLQARAQSEVHLALWREGVPAATGEFIALGIMQQGPITSGGSGAVLIDYVPAEVAARSYLTGPDGRDLVERLKGTVAAQKAADGKSSGNGGNGGGGGGGGGGGKTITRAEFERLPPQQKASVGLEAAAGKITVVDG